MKPDSAFHFQKTRRGRSINFFFAPRDFFWRYNPIGHFCVVTIERVLGEAAGVAVRRRRPVFISDTFLSPHAALKALRRARLPAGGAVLFFPSRPVLSSRA